MEKKKSNSRVEYFSDLTRKALQSKAVWTDKDEFLDSVYWIRQGIGAIIGVIWGILLLKGILGIIAFFILNAFIIYVYAITFQKIDEEEYGGIWEVLKEGLMTSFSTFLVAWIVIYSTFND